MNEVYEIFKENGYLLEERLAKDTYGELYFATYISHNAKVLLRRFPSSVSHVEKACRLAFAQVQCQARLRHPSILQVLDWGKVEGEAYFACERPNGVQILNLLRDNIKYNEYGSALFPEKALFSLLESLELARRWGILHLTLSPSNIWVEDGFKVQISEFGLWYLSREFCDFLPAWSPFLAPEQKQGVANASTDVYSAALAYIAMKFGIHVMESYLQGQPLPELPDSIRGPLAKALDERPMARYPTAGEFSCALGVQIPYGEVKYIHCPLCELQAKILEERRSPKGLFMRYFINIKASGLIPWLIILSLLAAALAVWWAAFRV